MVESGDKAAIQQDIATEKVLMYSKSFCPYCDTAKSVFKTGGVAVKVYELDQLNAGSTIQNTLKTITGQSTVPNIFIGGKHVGGCSDLQALQSSGKLAGMLTAAGVQNTF